MPFDDPVDRERAAQRFAVVEPPDQVDDVAQTFNERCRVEMVTANKLGHQGADRLQHAQHRRADAQRGGPLSGLRLVGPVDAEQVCALARDADDELAGIGRHHVVAVGDPAVQRIDPYRLPDEEAAVADEPFDLCPPVHDQRCSTSALVPRAKWAEPEPIPRTASADGARQSPAERRVCEPIHAA